MALNSPEVSVVIPTHNRLVCLPRAIRSVLTQEGCDIEVVVVDDASTDGTAKYLQGLADPRVRHKLLLKNEGACVARNEGIGMAKGEFVTFLDSDDEYLPGKVAIQAQALRRGGDRVGMAICGIILEDDSPVLPSPHSDMIGHLIGRQRGSVVGTPVLMVRRSLITEELLFDPLMPALQDRDFAVRWSAVHETTMIPRALVKVGRSPGDRVRTQGNVVRGLERLLEKHAEVLNSRPRVRSELHRQLAIGRFRLDSDGTAFRAEILRALRSDLSNLKNLPWVVASLMGPMTIKRLMRSRGYGMEAAQ